MCFGRFVVDTTDKNLIESDVIKIDECYESDEKIMSCILAGEDCEESDLIRIICSRSNDQRQSLKAEYNQNNSPRLEIQIAYSFDGDIRDLVLGLFMTPIQYKSFCIKEALSDTRRYSETIMTVIEILISSSPTEIQEIQIGFQQAYKKCLFTELHSKTKGYLQELFTILLFTPRSPDEEPVDDAAAQLDAEKIERCHGKEICSVDPKFVEIISILCRRSFEHLLRVSEIFEESTNMALTHFIGLNFFGLIKDCLLEILLIAESSAMFFACRLNQAFRLYNTGSKTLRRIIVSRREIDLDEIMESYLFQYGVSLDSHIRHRTSGFYKNLLVCLIR